jgi:hypothetical protein
MLPEPIAHNIARACVTVVKHDGARGRGVVVPGHCILTAAHCVEYTPAGALVLGDSCIVEIETMQGSLQTQLLAVEPVSDIAVLGALDGQEFWDETQALDEFCATTPPVPVSLEDLPLLQPFPIYIYTHRGQWLQGRAQLAGHDVPSLWIEMPEQIEAGTAGSPIVTERGTLIGIVSMARSETPQGCAGSQPRPHVALPVWVLRRIQAEQTGGIVWYQIVSAHSESYIADREAEDLLRQFATVLRDADGPVDAEMFYGRTPSGARRYYFSLSPEAVARAEGLLKSHNAIVLTGAPDLTGMEKIRRG